MKTFPLSASSRVLLVFAADTSAQDATAAAARATTTDQKASVIEVRTTNA
jgi:hypothetical protein